MDLKNLSKYAFFTEVPWYFKIFLIYVWGDALILGFFWIGVLLILIWNWKIALIASLLMIFIRALGEMIYWFSHQFSDRSYRPADFGLKNLDNHAIYILYQLHSQITLVISGMMLLGILGAFDRFIK